MSMQHAGHAMPAPAVREGTPNDHVPPPPPQHELPPMPPAHMADMMQMHDKALRGMWLFDRLERRLGTAGDGSTAWSAEGWWGGDIDRLWLKTEGERDGDGTRDARAELLWGHAASTFWDWQLGVRHDFGQGPSRQWIAAGVRGLAPYWFELAATLYAGPQGRTAARFEASYELRFTQRLILSPGLELNLYGKDDPRRGIRAGLSEAEAGLRLRYEFSRRFAPYVGIEQTRRFGRSAGVPRQAPARETAWVAGLRFWF
ncbi:copper resistance protein B [Frateuria sp. Soil773]|uniref:copper resistance protein B n=1 Tax=Frateuria sp. Soil773 TaxID=1736407 RepID=UPI00138EE557|nr:copper resistance protein B [Frateuria sp. Soil773]